MARTSTKRRQATASVVELAPREGPKRSSLAQERSRETRQKLVRAAIELWNERGFDTGIEETTAVEIADRAGVAKGTFYFHFARKEQVLLEMGWLTAKALYEDTLKALASGRPVDTVLDGVMTKLARRIEGNHRQAVRRAVLEFYRAPESEKTHDQEHFGFQRAFSVMLMHAQGSGELPEEASARDLAEMLTALVMDAIMAWTVDDSVDLAAVLRRRTAVLLAGGRQLAAPTHPRRARSRSHRS